MTKIQQAWKEDPATGSRSFAWRFHRQDPPPCQRALPARETEFTKGKAFDSHSSDLVMAEDLAGSRVAQNDRGYDAGYVGLVLSLSDMTRIAGPRLTQTTALIAALPMAEQRFKIAMRVR